MKKNTLTVSGMSCGHCVKSVKCAVSALPGVKNVLVDLAKKTVSIEYDSEKCQLDKIKSEIEGQGFDVLSEI